MTDRETLQKAYKLSLEKWNYIVKNNGNEKGLTEAFPYLEFVKSQCGYCDLFANPNTDCQGCPINLGFQGLCCCDTDHPFHIWFQDRTKENARAVLKLIKENKP